MVAPLHHVAVLLLLPHRHLGCPACNAKHVGGDYAAGDAVQTITGDAVTTRHRPNSLAPLSSMKLVVNYEHNMLSREQVLQLK